MEEKLISELKHFFTSIVSIEQAKFQIIDALEEVIMVETEEESNYHIANCYNALRNFADILKIIESNIKKS